VTDLPTGRVRVAVVGCGGRGTVYSSWILEHPDQAVVTAVVDPRESARDRLGDRAGVPAEHRYTDWRDLLTGDGAGQIADAVLICTQDRQHAEPAIAFADAGWHILLEKPMAPTEQECRAIHAAVTRAGVMFAVAHVLRYAAYTRAVKQVLDSGELGTLVNIEHLEPVGYWHFAHSYVRGNWRRTDESSPVLMAKSSHDIDLLQHWAGARYASVTSMGGLTWFKSANAPEGSGDRCESCLVEPDCEYSALQIYGSRLGRWPTTVVIEQQTEEALAEALHTGQYGRCVYRCDNDVNDHQSVIATFDNGVTASFTMTAFTEKLERYTKVMGSHGTLWGDGNTFTVLDFRTGAERTVDPAGELPGGVGGGHSGGDGGLIEGFVAAVASGNPDTILSGPDASLDAHLAIFAAERARVRGTVEPVHSVDPESRVGPTNSVKPVASGGQFVTP
jgi:predicted dehydrogenase